MPSGADHTRSGDILQNGLRDSKRRKMYQLLSMLYLVVVIVGLLNFLLFLAGTFYIGGDAVNGEVANGKYYVWGYRYSDGFKGFSEVSRSVFEYSRWHVYSVWASFSIMMIGTFLYKRPPTGD